MPVAVTLSLPPVANRYVATGSGNNVLLVLRLTSPSGDAELTRLSLAASSSGNDLDVTSVKLVVDNNANGVLDTGEAVIAEGRNGADNGTLDLTMATPFAVPAGDTNLLLTYDF